MNDFYADLADALHGVATDLATLAGANYPKLAVSINIQPLPHDMDDEKKTAVIDAIGLVLVGKAGTGRRMSSGNYHHDADGFRGPVQIGVFGRITSPEDRVKDAEIARLRTELAAACGEVEQPGGES